MKSGGFLAISILGLALLPAKADDLLQRGEALLQAGDISGARLALQVPADEGSVEAKRCLAETYDRDWLTKHGVIPPDGFADDAKAAELYRGAAQVAERGQIDALRHMIKDGK